MKPKETLLTLEDDPFSQIYCLRKTGYGPTNGLTDRHAFLKRYVNASKKFPVSDVIKIYHTTSLYQGRDINLLSVCRESYKWLAT